MGLEKGSATFVILCAPEKVSNATVTPLLAEKAYLTMPESSDGPTIDVTRGVSTINKRPDGDLNFQYGPTTYFAIRSRDRKKDPQMVKEYFAYLVDKEISETGKTPKGKRKKELKAIAIEAAKPSDAIKTSAIRVIIPENSKMVIAETSTLKKADEVCAFLAAGPLSGNDPFIFGPEYLYNVLTGKTADSYDNLKFHDEVRASGIGVDFLTWLWMASETPGVLPDTIQVAPFGDISFRNDKESSKGSEITKLSKGLPLGGGGAKAALDDGKKVCSMSLCFQKDEDTSYSVVVDEKFIFKKFKVNETEKSCGAPQELFGEAVVSIQDFMEIFITVFKRFLNKAEENQDLMVKWYESHWPSN